MSFAFTRCFLVSFDNLVILKHAGGFGHENNNKLENQHENNTNIKRPLNIVPFILGLQKISGKLPWMVDKI